MLRLDPEVTFDTGLVQCQRVKQTLRKLGVTWQWIQRRLLAMSNTQLWIRNQKKIAQLKQRYSRFWITQCWWLSDATTLTDVDSLSEATADSESLSVDSKTLKIEMLLLIPRRLVEANYFEKRWLMLSTLRFWIVLRQDSDNLADCSRIWSTLRFRYALWITRKGDCVRKDPLSKALTVMNVLSLKTTVISPVAGTSSS